MESGNVDQSTSSDEEPQRFVVRRRPNPTAFILAGTLLGLFISGIWAFTQPETAKYSYAAVLGYTSVAFGMVGAILGGLLAVLLDRRK